METYISQFSTYFEALRLAFQAKLPSMATALALFLLGLFVINQVKNILLRVLNKYSKDPLVNDFLGNLLALALTVILISLCLNILGLGSLTNKILAGAGLSAFVVGFALKDIGENFLAGIIMAFKRPFKVGDIIEIDKVKGKVVRMDFRETIIKTSDGKDIFIPNALILKNPLQNYTNDDLLQEEFDIKLEYQPNVENTLKLIEKTVRAQAHIQAEPTPRALIDALTSEAICIKILFWYSDNAPISGSQLRSQVMLAVLQMLESEKITMYKAK